MLSSNFFFDTTKVLYFTNTKDETALLNRFTLVYKFSCPGCQSAYIGKTKRALHERKMEHTWLENSIITVYWSGIKHIVQLRSINRENCTVTNSDKALFSFLFLQI